MHVIQTINAPMTTGDLEITIYVQFFVLAMIGKQTIGECGNTDKDGGGNGLKVMSRLYSEVEKSNFRSHYSVAAD